MVAGHGPVGKDFQKNGICFRNTIHKNFEVRDDRQSLVFRLNHLVKSLSQTAYLSCSPS